MEGGGGHDEAKVLVYIIAWSAVVLGINSTSNAGSNYHDAKPSEISCITSPTSLPPEPSSILYYLELN